ncbi:F-box protein [Quillaja saponaria]|uniref:F-box protein n=1 Tax=Quillaja saponaria TaxID=32244 RepID=A0AAD7PW28_QUISA|nr:F-box protein [Quillaja saponaria]
MHIPRVSLADLKIHSLSTERFLFSTRCNMTTIENSGDFVQLLGPDMSIKIFNHLDDPSDLIRVCTVSCSWRQLVIENGLCKQLCLKMFPEISGAAHVIEVDDVIEPINYRLWNSMDLQCLKRNHRVYASLARGLTTSMRKDCISEAISASSTDNYPEESIQNTLEPSDRTELRASYWSSKGDSDPSVPEKLLYKLKAKICVVTEIHVQPFQAYFQYGSPIYSAKAVRFRMGHPKYPVDLENAIADDPTAGRKLDDKRFIWTYTSPELLMAQENCLQKFKLPEPVLSVGGVLLVELLGRVQRQEMDGLFYICISHVQVVGRPLSPAFAVQILHPSGKCTLSYDPQTDCSSPSSSKGQSSTSCRLNTFTSRIVQRGMRRWEQMIYYTLLGSGVVAAGDQSNEDHPS